MDIKRLLSLIILMFVFQSVSAQQNLGVATGNWSSMNSLYLNPANLGGSPEKVVIGLVSLNIGVDNNLGTFTKIGNLGNAVKSDSNSTGGGVFTNSGKKYFSMMLPEVSIHGPGLLYAVNAKHTFALTTGIRAINQFNNFDQSLYTNITNTSSISKGNYSITTQQFNWTLHMWSELGLSYGGVLVDEARSQLKVGATIRRLGGIAYIGLRSNNLDLGYSAGADSFYASNSDLHFASNVLSDSSAVFSGISAGSILSKAFGASAGSGLGGDIGIVYRYRFGNLDPIDYMDSKETHDLTFSVSIMDLGAITYKQNTNSIINVSGNGYITGSGLSKNVKDVTSFENYMKQQGFSADTASVATKVHMPTRLIIGVDYQIYERIYANLTYIGNLANRENFGNSYYNQVTITPRYNWKLMSFGLPITYSALAGDMKIGFGYRVSGFFIGSDDMMALLSNNQHGFNFYFGGYIPIMKKEGKTSTTPYSFNK